MKKSAVDAAAFLKNMQTAEPAPPSRAGEPRRASAGRAGLKHIGGYLDPTTVEMFAVLRARLGLDNSELITLAIGELHARAQAKRAFGDS